MKKITTVKSNQSIESLMEAVKPHAPEGYVVGRCFLLAMSGASSPEMVDIRPARRTPEQEFARRAMPKEQRIELARALEARAKQLLLDLQAKGFTVARDGASVYVKHIV